MAFGMDSGLYKAIQEGNVDGMKQLIIANHDQSGSGDHYLLQAMTTSLNSSPLHIAAQFNQLECLEEIFYICPSLLMKQNSEGDTALHIASRLKLDRVVMTLIGWATNSADVAGGGGGLTKLQQLVRITNKKNDTALHETLQYVGPSDNLVLPWLIDADPGFDYVANDAGETPLYLAVENATLSEIEYILDKSPSQAHGAPNGRTVLHTAMQLNDYFRSADTVKILLKKKPHLVKEVDKDGRSALHYAASLYRAQAFANILDIDSSVGYLRDKDGMTALHYVAGDHFFVNPVDFAITYNLLRKMYRKLAECCPDCWEMRDNKGRNFLHIAAENKKVYCFKYIFKNMPSSPTNNLMVINLLNRRENNGKTPYDLLLSEEVPDEKIPEEFLSDRDECLRIIKLDPRARNYIRPRRDYDLDVPPKNREEGKLANNNEQPQDLEGQANMVVATLLATIAFAAAFAVPGGYTSKGTATLATRTAFIIFLVCNNLTMFLACLSMLSYFVFVSLRQELGASRIKSTSSLHDIPTYCTVLAIPTMMGAFVAGTYAVLSEFPGLAIPICILGCSFFPVSFVIYWCALLKVGHTATGRRVEFQSYSWRQTKGLI